MPICFIYAAPAQHLLENKGHFTYGNIANIDDSHIFLKNHTAFALSIKCQQK